MTAVTTFRRQVAPNVFLVATRGEDGAWNVTVTDAFSHPTDEATRVMAVKEVLGELSSLRQWLWKEELELGKK